MDGKRLKSTLVWVCSTLFWWGFLSPANLAFGQQPLPPAVQPGISEKSLQKARPRFESRDKKIPDITVQDSRSLTDPGAGPAFKVRKIEIEGNTLISNAALAPLVDVGDGMDATLGVLELMAQEVTAYYALQGYLLTRVYIPAQEIKDGRVILRVVEGRLGAVEISGNRHWAQEDLLERMELVLKQPVLKEETLERTLLSLNDIQGLQVDSILKPGKDLGQADLLLKVEESRPYSISFDADNYGSRFTGRNRFGLTGSIDGLAKFGDRLTLRAVRTAGGQTFFNPRYEIPLNNRGTRWINSYVYSEHLLGANLVPLRAGGSSHLWSTDIQHMFYRTRLASFYAGAGFDFKFFENFQGGQTTSDDEMHNLHLNVGGSLTDALFGETLIDGRLQFGYTEVNARAPLNSRALGRGNAVIGALDITRYQSAFVANSFFLIRFHGQWADRRVLSPDQIAIGGVGAVRGYPLAEAAADDGFFTTLEYVLPFPWDIPLGRTASPSLKETVSLFGFIDYGRVFVRNRQPEDAGDQDLTGVGGGFRFNLPPSDDGHPQFNFSFFYAIPPFAAPNPSDGSRGTVYLAGMVTF